MESCWHNPIAGQQGLTGQNDWERSQSDMYVDCFYYCQHGGSSGEKITLKDYFCFAEVVK